ncbi:MAG: endonuclease/exonuclease/phosphatase family protein [Bacteroidetes bacterium]|nr:endonuclease/exonuclease/phosphatase family protein [Bacteroidota bacterium]
MKRRIFYLFTAFSIVALLYYLTIPAENPFSPLPYFASFLFVPVFLLNVLIFIFWLLKRKRIVWFSIVALAVSLPEAAKYYGVSFSGKDVSEGSIKILTFNVRNFDVYNYNKDWSFNTTIRDSIFRFLGEEKPDIACFQEYFFEISGKFKTSDTLPGIMSAPYLHANYSKQSYHKNYFGLATFSRYPIISTGHVYMVSSRGNQCIFSDIKIGNDTIRVYNMHLESAGFSYDDLRFRTDDNAKPIRKGKEKVGLRSKLTHLTEVAIIRYMQAMAIADHIKNSPYRVLVCGDMNDNPSSITYNFVKGRLRDGFRERGASFGNTYMATRLPFLRIDFVFADKSIQFVSYDIPHCEFSDHYPTVAKVAVGARGD